LEHILLSGADFCPKAGESKKGEKDDKKKRRLGNWHCSSHRYSSDDFGHILDKCRLADTGSLPRGRHPDVHPDSIDNHPTRAIAGLLHRSTTSLYGVIVLGRFHGLAPVPYW